MASEETQDQAVVFGDEFLADEILARLPVRCAVRCTVLSKRFRQLLASPHFWLRHRRLGTPLELPHVARLQRYDDDNREVFCFQFHLVGPTFLIEHAVSVEECTFEVGTCNGLVLLSGFSSPNKGQSSFSINGVVFNPATKEEARISLQLPNPGKENVHHDILGFGYGPSSKVYKVLIREYDKGTTRLMVVSLDSCGGQEPRTVFSSSQGDMNCHHNLNTGDGKLYLLIYVKNLFQNTDVSVLVFHVDTEAMTKIDTPEGHEVSTTMMLVVRGRPCVYEENDQDTVIWLLNADHRWEQLYNLVKKCTGWDDYLLGTWDCGDDLLFANFRNKDAYLYNLQEDAGEVKEDHGCNTRLAAVSSLKIKYKSPGYGLTNLWDYQPTLISPASIFGDAAFSGSGHQSVALKHELDETFLKITQKWVLDPVLHMLSALHPPSRD